MSYCINPWCQHPENPDHLERCQSCGTDLLINERYRVLSSLSTSSDSDTQVYEIDSGGRRKVMKVLTVNKPTLVRLFRQETQVLRQLNRPGIPQVETDFIFSPRNGPRQLHCIILERIKGEDLEGWLRRNPPISKELAIAWLKQLVEILDSVHQQGFFHRDIKPSNIMITPEENLVLIDFGAARKITQTYHDKIELGREITGVYSPGGYTPVEQLIGRAVPQSDFFSLGRTFVQLLTGELPECFDESDSGELIWQEKAPNIPESLAELIDDLMAPLAENRPRNTQEILQRLVALEKGANFVPKTEKWLSIHKKRVVIGVGLLLTVLSIHGLSPALAIFLNYQGLERYKRGELQQASFYYELALKLNPKDGTISNNLGIIEEDRVEMEKACDRYRRAKNQDTAAGYNNLARCYIDRQEYDTAAALLMQGLQRADSEAGKYAILKNLGWARWGQTLYDEAETHLRVASEMMGDRAPAYCLLAQVLEAQGDSAFTEWQNCLRYASRYDRDEDTWIALAKQRLAAHEE